MIYNMQSINLPLLINETHASSLKAVLFPLELVQIRC